MSIDIEKQLTEAFRQDARHWKRQPSLETRIAAEYRRQMKVSKGEINMKKIWKMPKVILIAMLAVMILSGFVYAGGKLLFEDQRGGFTVSVQSDERFNLDSETVDKLRAQLKDVRDQLLPGEAAIVFSSALDDEGWLSANNPIEVMNLDAWRSILLDKGVTSTLPDELAGGFAFEEGLEGHPFMAMLDLNDLKTWKQLRSESAKDGTDFAWRKTGAKSDPPTYSYTSVYRNSQVDTVYVSHELLNGSTIKAEMAVPTSNEYEMLEWGGQKAHYTKSEQWLYGNSNIYKNMMWIDEIDGETIVIHVGTDSPGVTKDQLESIARSLSSQADQ